MSGKIAGVTGALPLAAVEEESTPLPCCCSGVVIAVAPPWKDSDAGEASAVACGELDGCVVRVSIFIIESYDMVL